MLDQSKTTGRKILFLAFLLALLSIGQLVNMAFAPSIHAFANGLDLANHWDYRVYKASSDLVANGGDPLDFTQLKAMGVNIPYNYSPAFTRATSWMLAGDYHAAETRFIAAKLLAIVASWIVLVVGLRLRGLWPALAAFMLTFGFGSAVLVDMAAGNITAFELLWISGLTVGAWRRWDALFVVTLFLLCLGKPIWGIFAIVPVALYWDRRSALSFGLGMAAFALPLVLSGMISPAGTRQYLTSAFAFRETGYINPCSREMIGRVVARLRLPDAIGTLAWAASAITLAVVAIRRRAAAGVDGTAIGAALLLLLPFLLPRFKPYAFALLIPFLVLALSKGTFLPRRAAWIMLFAAAPFLIRIDLALVILLSEGTLLTFVGYFPLFLTGATLLALVGTSRRTPAES